MPKCRHNKHYTIASNSSKEEQVVFDAFMGSGTTGVACVNLKRKFIGTEINKEYFEIAKERINNAIINNEDKNKQNQQLTLF